MSGDFLIWSDKAERGAAVLRDFRGFEDTHSFRGSKPLADVFPPDAAFHMDPEAPHDLVLPDNVRNTALVTLVSRRLREAMTDFGVKDIEYLPVKVFNHKNRLASDSHVIARTLDLVDAIDRDKSVFEPHPFLEGRLDAVDRLVVDPARVPKHKSVFRLDGYPDLLLVTPAIAQALDRGGFTGLEWLPLDEYSE
jgi:hypothetical protein